MDEVVIKAENLSKVYKIYEKDMDRLKETFHPFHKRYSKDFYALKDVNFEIKRGENVGLVGKNGAGKSTLLKIITGVLTPTSGNISVNGKIASLLELGAGFNPDEPINDTKRSHIGIVNVRERLEQMVGGKLIITSEKGSGTTAVIIIPKV